MSSLVTKIGKQVNQMATAYIGLFTAVSGTFTIDIQPSGWAVVALFGILSGMAVLLFQLGAKYIGAQKTSLFSTFEPLTSVLIGITVYKEAMTPRVVCGLVSILVAVVLLAAVKEKQNASICE